MKQSLKQILSSQIILIPAIFLAACSSPFNSNKSSEYQIPWRTESVEYELQAVAIESLSDPEKLSSPLVRLFVTPAEENGQLAGPPAVGRFMTRMDGVRIPLDFVSMQGASIHAHVERIHAFDRAVGIDNLLNWPLQISIETEITSKKERSNNAFFDGARNAILILPYTDHEKEGLPLSLNGGVLTHEYFHAIFDKLVMKKLTLAGLHVSRQISELAATEPPTVPEVSDAPPATSKISTNDSKQKTVEFNEFLLRATNEGLADFWSWLQLEDIDFVGRSISTLRECRRMDKGFSHIPDAASLRSRVFQAGFPREESSKFRDWMYYQVGAQYARFFRELTLAVYGEKPSYVDRVEIARAVVQALGEFSNSVIPTFEKEEIATDHIVDLITKSLPKARLNKKSCAVFAEFKPDGAELPQGCSGLGVDRNDVMKSKIARFEKSPQLEKCSCVTNEVTGTCD